MRTAYDAPQGRGDQRLYRWRAAAPATAPSRSVFSAETSGGRTAPALLGLLRRRATLGGGRPTAAKAELGGRALSQGGHAGH